MKRAIRACLAAFVLAGAPSLGNAAWGPDQDVSVAGTIRSPGAGDFDVYDSACGFELQYRYWAWDDYGFALSVGMESWEVADGSSEWGDGFEGTLNLVPLGASLVARPWMIHRATVTLEAGLRYLLADSEVEYGVETVEIEDALLARFAWGIQYPVSDRICLFGNAGYEMDVVLGGVEVEAGKLQDNELQSFFAQAGVRVTF